MAQTRHVWSGASPKEAVATLLLATRVASIRQPAGSFAAARAGSADAVLTRVTCDLNDLLRYTSGTQENQKRPASANRAHRQNPLKTRAPALFNVSQKTCDCSCRTARLARDSPSVWSFRHAAAHAQRDLGLIVAQGLKVQDHDCGARTAGPRKGGARSPPVRRRH